MQADPAVSTLQSTAFVAGVALRVARHDRGRCANTRGWPRRRVLLAEIRELTEAPHAIALAFAVAVRWTRPTTPRGGGRAAGPTSAAFVPADGLVPVAGGSDGETLRALDFAPLPDRPARALFRTT